MIEMEFTAALESARTLTFVDEIARDLWRAYGAGRIGETEAEGVAARIEEARRRIRPKDTARARAPGVPLVAISMYPPRKRRCVSPDRVKSRERRRRLAYSGPLPPALAAGFTTGQLATLRIVADEVRTRGTCRLTLGEIAARAGVGVTTARNAIRLAAADGLLVITERRRHGAPSLPNDVKIISREWRTWVARSGEAGSKNPRPTDTTVISASLTCLGRGSERLRRNIHSSEAPPARERKEERGNSRSISEPDHQVRQRFRPAR